MQKSQLSWRITPRWSLFLVLMLLGGFILAGAGPMAVLADDDFIEVNVTFVNASDLDMGIGGSLKHGCWDKQPPNEIEPHTTVTWRAVSCGVATGTEGEVLFLLRGLRPGVTGRVYWNNPFVGDNSGDATAPNGCNVTRQGPGTGNTLHIHVTLFCPESGNDGIPDLWKIHGAVLPATDGSNEEQFIDLPRMGARVGQRDIFVHMDWMASSTRTQQIDNIAIRRVHDAFLAKGYHLHVDHGFDSELFTPEGGRWGQLSKANSVAVDLSLGSGSLDAQGNIVGYNWAEFDAIKNAPVSVADTEPFQHTGRARIFRYALGAVSLGNAAGGTFSFSGLARTGAADTSGGTDFIITLGSFGTGAGTIDQQTGTFMHELGHTLGLEHGGGDQINWKPNYFSVMNYAFQMTGVIKNGNAGNWDYHAAPVFGFNETGLNERPGLGPQATGYGTSHWCPGGAAPALPMGRITVANAASEIDWNCNGVLGESGYNFDINNDSPRQPANTLNFLSGYDDWANLKITVGPIGQLTGALGAQPQFTSSPREITPEDVAVIVPLDTVAPVSQASAAPPPNTAGWNNTNVTVTISAADDASGVARIEWNLDGAGWNAYTAPVVISTDLVHTLQYRAIDRGQNVENAKSLTIRLDKTPPTITFGGNAGTYSILDTVNITCDATDNLSGVASSTCQNVSGPAYNFTPGTNSFSATAADVAGNTGSGTASFTLRVTYADLCTLSKQFVTNKGVALSRDMCAQLTAAEAAQARGNPSAKAQAIAAYIKDVDAAVKGGYMSPANAAILKKLAGGL